MKIFRMAQEKERVRLGCGMLPAGSEERENTMIGTQDECLGRRFIPHGIFVFSNEILWSMKSDASNLPQILLIKWQKS